MQPVFFKNYLPNQPNNKKVNKKDKNYNSYLTFYWEIYYHNFWENNSYFISYSPLLVYKAQQDNNKRAIDKL